MITTDTRARTPHRLFAITLAGLGLAAAASTVTHAGCSQYESITAEICLTAGSFCPKGTLPAQGQLLSIKNYPMLFSLVGTSYGGDGQHTFALPDLRGRVPVGVGKGPGVTPVELGDKRGSDTTVIQKNTAVTQGDKPDTTVAVPATVDITNPQLGMRYCIVTEGTYPQRPDK